MMANFSNNNWIRAISSLERPFSSNAIIFFDSVLFIPWVFKKINKIIFKINPPLIYKTPVYMRHLDQFKLIGIREIV